MLNTILSATDVDKLITSDSGYLLENIAKSWRTISIGVLSPGDALLSMSFSRILAVTDVLSLPAVSACV